MTFEDFNLFSLLQFNIIKDGSSDEVSHKVFQKLSMKIQPSRKENTQSV